MKGTRHRQEQIITILKQGEAGLATELCRQYGITAQTYDRWKRNTADREQRSQAAEKCCKRKNRNLKHAVADLTPDNRELKEVLARNF
jgi:putative transposase